MLYYLLFLFLQFVNEVRGQLEDDCHERAGDGLVHQVLELDLLADEVNRGACLLEEPGVELESSHIAAFTHGLRRLAGTAVIHVALPLFPRSLNVPPFELSVRPLLAEAAKCSQLYALVRAPLIVLSSIVEAHVSIVDRGAGLRLGYLAAVLLLALIDFSEPAFDFIFVRGGQVQVVELDLQARHQGGRALGRSLADAAWLLLRARLRQLSCSAAAAVIEIVRVLRR